MNDRGKGQFIISVLRGLSGVRISVKYIPSHFMTYILLSQAQKPQSYLFTPNFQLLTRHLKIKCPTSNHPASLHQRSQKGESFLVLISVAFSDTLCIVSNSSLNTFLCSTSLYLMICLLNHLSSQTEISRRAGTISYFLFQSLCLEQRRCQ